MEVWVVMERWTWAFLGVFSTKELAEEFEENRPCDEVNWIERVIVDHPEE